ncbi:cupin [Streptomyces griseoincarnatus]|uniref:Cupin n=1 Tax=Streptomyces griseoincarnatus TaxID=29305 RepID=A0ABT0VTD4_STRGI|nr:MULTISPECIES: cupin [Streptomyces]MBJ6627370.1 cupin [Streptomyces sp. I4(2020)]MCM2514618.1 cupin [Streptomyces griseoincarnatus]
MPLPLPGAVGLSHLRAYEWEAADGVCGGSPHVHLACTEAYVVTGGSGAVQTLSVEGGYREVPLREGVVTWFAPGTVHRMVRGEGGDGGALRVTVLMENSGLPEAGDAVFTFPAEVLGDVARYAEAADVGDEAAARRRRDLAVEGYLGLREALRAGDVEPYREFLRAAAGLVRDRVPRWRELWEAGAVAAVRRTGERLDALGVGDVRYLEGAGVWDVEPSRRGGLGMCGWRDAYGLPV